MDPANISEGELRLLEAFRALGTAPKADTKEDLEAWMAQYVASRAVKEDVKQEDDPPATNPLDKMKLEVTVPRMPRLPIFGGTDAKKDSEASYDVWRYEVTSLLEEKHHDETSILEAVRRSLKGEAARAAMRIRPKPSLTTLLVKFDSLYGTVKGSDIIMADFYNAKQGEDEDVSAWSCRVEDLVAKAVESGGIVESKADEVLRSRFWHGLRDELKHRTGHKYDAAEDFDTLRRQIREFELDNPSKQTKKNEAKVKSAQSTPREDNSEMKAMQKSIEQLTLTVRSLQQDMKQQQSDHRRQSAGDQRKPYDYGRQSGPDPKQSDYDGELKGPSGDYYGAGLGRGGRRPQRGGQQQQGQRCYNCGEIGHIQVGCTTRMDHSWRNYQDKRPYQQSLNYRRSAGGDNL